VSYRYIECIVEDMEVLNGRLQGRPALRSQRLSVEAPPRDYVADGGPSGAELFRYWLAGMKRPEGNYLRLDTSRQLWECVEEAVAFLGMKEGLLPVRLTPDL